VYSNTTVETFLTFVNLFHNKYEFFYTIIIFGISTLVYLTCVGFYACVLRLLNREIDVLNDACKKWMDELKTGSVNNANCKLNTMIIWHAKLCRCVQLADNMFSSFGGCTVALMTVMTTIMIYVMLRSTDILAVLFAFVPPFLFTCYILFRVVYVASALHDKVGFYFIYIYFFYLF
jgi:hypothetical protein